MLKRLTCAILILALAASLWYIAATTYDPMYGAADENEESAEMTISNNDTDDLTIWYTDGALTDYLSSVASLYQQSSGRKVNLVLKDGVEFLENINKVSIADANDRTEAVPDMYITSHDNLLRAYLSGLAAVVSDPQNIMNDTVFPDTALHAVTCYGNYVGYPLYYETEFFLYNKTYMESIAQKKIESENDLREGEEATEDIENGENESENAEDEDSPDEPDDGSEDSAEEETGADTADSDAEEAAGSEAEDDDASDVDPMGDEDAEASQEVLDRLSTMIPATLEDVTTFANNYDAPDEVESVFKWDVTDIFYNYFFIGNYVDVGGEDGDNAAVFNIYNTQSAQCLSAFQGMNQFFTIDTKTDDYDSILQDFIDGKLVFTVATTDAMEKIRNARNEGNFNFEYGVTTLPDINSLLKTKGLSVTDAVVVNEYSDKKEDANMFASYLTVGRSDELYEKTGKVSCCRLVNYEETEMDNIMAEYEKSVPLPKMVETANYWVQLEIAFAKVWDGSDPDETLKELSDTIGAQIEEIRAQLPTQESFGAGAGGYVQ